MSNNVIVIGSYVQDHCWNTTQFPGVGESRIGTFSTGPGGKGFNQAVACHRQGVATTFVGAIGNDALGETAKQFARSQGLNALWQECDGVSTAASSIVVNAKGENLICVALGANESLSAAFVAQHAALIASSQVMVLQLENELAATRRALELARQDGVRSILNTAPINAQADFELIQLADIITPNETEFADLIARFFGDEAAAREAKQAAQLPDAALHALCRRLNVPTVVVTLGEHGCFVSHADAHAIDTRARLRDTHTHYRVAPNRVHVRDTTGAGDAFTGGLAAGLIRFADQPFRRAVEHAGRVAALSTEQPGTAPAMPSFEWVQERFGE